MTKLLVLTLSLFLFSLPTFAIDQDRKAPEDTNSYVGWKFSFGFYSIAVFTTDTLADEVGRNVFNGHLQAKIGRSTITCIDDDCVRGKKLAEEMAKINKAFFNGFTAAFSSGGGKKRRGVEYNDSTFTKSLFNGSENFEDSIKGRIKPIIKQAFTSKKMETKINDLVINQHHHSGLSVHDVYHNIKGRVEGRGDHAHSRIQGYLQDLAEKASKALKELRENEKLVKYESELRLINVLVATYDALSSIPNSHPEGGAKWLPGDYVLYYGAVCSAGAEVIDQMLDEGSLVNKKLISRPKREARLY